MSVTEEMIKGCVDHPASRFDLWVRFLKSVKAKRVAEIGVYEGEFASRILRGCHSIEKYYMIDPWRRLDNWNKPRNTTDSKLEQCFSKTISATDFAASKRVILRGKTVEVVGQIPDGELDFAYIDGDHTLRGITIDLIRIFPKIKVGGWIGGDDFTRTVWQHPTMFEPTLVFPFAVHFAEAVGAQIYTLPGSQFLMEKTHSNSFAFVDLVGHYSDWSLGTQFSADRMLKLKLTEELPLLMKIARKIKGLWRYQHPATPSAIKQGATVPGTPNSSEPSRNSSTV